MYEPKLPVSGYPLAVLAFTPFVSKAAIILLIITCMLVMFRFIRLLYKEHNLVNLVVIILLALILVLSIYIYKSSQKYELLNKEVKVENEYDNYAKEEKNESIILKSGDKVGVLKIDKISLEIDVLEDASDKNMFLGAGHILGTPYPWEDGNSFIASHNVKNEGLLFNRLNELKIGDEVVFFNNDMRMKYVIYDVEIVDGDDKYCFNKLEGNRNLSLVTCSNGKRLVVYCRE